MRGDEKRRASPLLRLSPHDVLRTICPQQIEIIDAALAPLHKRFFEGALPEPTRFEAIFIMARSWSGFVQLAETDKVKLEEDGKIVSVPITGMQAAYKWTSG